MPSLIIPESGLSLRGSQESSSKHGSMIPEVFGLTLTDNVIEEMIKCVQNGKPIQLSLGEHQSISYGTKTQHLATSIDPFTHELYRSTNSDSDSDSDSMTYSNRDGKRKLLSFGGLFSGRSLKPGPKPPVASKAKATATAPSGDSALAALQSSLAMESARKQENTVKYIKEGLPVPGRRGAPGSKLTNKNKLLSSNRALGGDAARSMPSSPALSGVGSPSLGPTSVPQSQQNAEQAKTARKPIIHLLASGPMSERALKEQASTSGQEFKNALEKVGDLNETSGKWELRKQYWKELDVWSYDYSNDEDRQRAIDNAVKQYDKMRLGISEPEWDRLLPKSERGTGKCLSKLQAQIAQGVGRGPKGKGQKDDGSGRDTSPGEEDEALGNKSVSKTKGDGASKPASQPPATKAKKVSEKEAQAKRLLSGKPSKAAPKPTPRAPAAKKEKAPKPGTKVLSSEFVEDSDDEDDLPPVTKAPPKPAPAPKKRARDMEEETSDSSVPLSKKIKKDAQPPHRIPDSSQSSRATNHSMGHSNHSNHSTQSLSSAKSKDTSPQKSSPLASSPPTNASEFEHSSGNRTISSSSASPAPHIKASGTRSPIQKRHHKSSSVASSTSSTGSTRYLKPEVVDLARKYRSYYPKYEALHRELANMRSRNSEKEQQLLDMHERLAVMKREINAGIVEISVDR
ncbi:hypothetical protein BGZ60DRAFT_369363 [Tricladium varicosporioides]|nr:hypothetical protein BGZ60DRAFT_369363 [Hymenoscyphus varicosporioides]